MLSIRKKQHPIKDAKAPTFRRASGEQIERAVRTVVKRNKQALLVLKNR
jgi:hypothetical protein